MDWRNFSFSYDYVSLSKYCSSQMFNDLILLIFCHEFFCLWTMVLHTKTSFCLVYMGRRHLQVYAQMIFCLTGIWWGLWNTIQFVGVLFLLLLISLWWFYFFVLCFCSWWLSHVDRLPSWMVKRCCASVQGWLSVVFLYFCVESLELLIVKRCAFYGFVVACFYQMLVKRCFVASSSKRLNLVLLLCSWPMYFWHLYLYFHLFDVLLYCSSQVGSVVNTFRLAGTIRDIVYLQVVLVLQ